MYGNGFFALAVQWETTIRKLHGGTTERRREFEASNRWIAEATVIKVQATSGDLEYVIWRSRQVA